MQTGMSATVLAHGHQARDDLVQLEGETLNQPSVQMQSHLCLVWWRTSKRGVAEHVTANEPLHLVPCIGLTVCGRMLYKNLS